MLFAPKEKGKTLVEFAILIAGALIIIIVCGLATIGYCKLFALFGQPGDC